MIYLLGGLVFGVLLEYFEIITDSYTYGHFQIMLGRAPHDLPLWIGAAWGIIMYTARLFSDCLGLPALCRSRIGHSAGSQYRCEHRRSRLPPAHVALALDDIHLALTNQWFGIPYGNFIGWATVVFCYSGFTRLFERWMARRKPCEVGQSQPDRDNRRGVVAGRSHLHRDCSLSDPSQVRHDVRNPTHRYGGGVCGAGCDWMA